MNKTINYIRIMHGEDVITKGLNFERDLHKDPSLLACCREDMGLHQYCCENLNSYTNLSL
jgi:hypothetical protein